MENNYVVNIAVSVNINRITKYKNLKQKIKDERLTLIIKYILDNSLNNMSSIIENILNGKVDTHANPTK